jgi:NDP-sugar pyrophosphorylase family protein
MKCRSPYGVVRLSDGVVCSLEEKPRQSFSVNAGIYVLDPSMVELIPPSGPCDMPDLICAALERNLRVGGFPIQEYWVDIGSPTDYVQAQKGYDEHFKEKDPQR